MKVAVLLLVGLCATFANADIYLHNARGGNNRLDEANRDRNNGNRLFDSQNNDRGGSNVGSLYYYVGSQLPITWTNQHSCNNPNAKCNMVIQYTCDDRIRDGTTTNTIPTTPNQCENNNCDTDVEYGRHESLNWYNYCKYRQRNKGLFTANQNLNGDSARFTRQNNAGTRRGYECPEERDYYPYWYPTVWRDIAVLTNDATMCPYYTAQSQNVKSRWYCAAPQAFINDRASRNQEGFIPITKAQCEAIYFAGQNGTWVESPAWGIAAPICRETDWTRDNHLGNGLLFGENAGFNWTIPADLVHDKCVLRLRYNISTTDYDDWTHDGSVAADSGDSTYNTQPNNIPAQVDVWSKFGISKAEVQVQFDAATGNRDGNNNDNAAVVKNSRGYVFKNNPRVDIFGSLLNSQIGDTRVRLQLAINTNQFGRTFQDRTHTFQIRERPDELKDTTIYNVNVRGKRGNIVQTYPGTEYDFVPNRLLVKNGEYVHFQWTGSNTNPDNNAGQGKAGTDRHNVVGIRAPVYAEGQPTSGLKVYGQLGSSYPNRIDGSTPFLGFSQLDRQHLAILDNLQLGGEMSELDDAGTYFDLGPKAVSSLGVYHYLCTRNNNFSNRGQKGTVIVSDNKVVTTALGWNGGWAVADDKNRLWADVGTFNQLWPVTVNTIPVGSLDALPFDSVASHFVEVYPPELATAPGKTFTLQMAYESSATETFAVYRAPTRNAAIWTQVDADMSGDIAAVQGTQGGAYVVVNKPNVGAIVGATVACVAVLVIVATTVIYFKKNPAKWEAAKKKAMYLKRSMDSKV
ncbi:hypothetical protein CAOG_03538 [Capsaspora owczarzaki ATCC 30864]|uniref:Uncharacterized protein n=1 Tax=Capsaspora owczarzaki (strain ATCC 30864) TaxID=595528 RepID=A0A0D2X2I4_CAPO3|nr:hypothetical protein CAOG_03538 [Capsaspora owczarzaki ATCC 30864]KJE92614.1 hypothetical protein CAOG_003538 [Capsaspora owczarzaki ATCC 30864]|eukprot:XP_004348443.1 hypothetical protein CAOG_03538 [Capsaspora owczarzaki ATCC 30864]